jgi:TIGR03009 family protein
MLHSGHPVTPVASASNRPDPRVHRGEQGQPDAGFQGRKRAFMLRRRVFPRAALLVPLVLSGGWLAPLAAQSEAPRGRAADGGDRRDRRDLTRPDLRVQAEEPVDPQVEELLSTWSKSTKKIEKLQGQHARAIRDFTTGIEKVAQGQFYYEAPDKGRIDLRPWGTARGTKVTRPTANGKAVELQQQPDRAERWICDGTTIKVIDDERKEYDVVDIPPDQRGAKVIDGPLPFLFGMPPDKAKARYRFRILGQEKSVYEVEVLPKKRLDAAEWRRAVLRLDSANYYLPKQVHLYDPAGTKETVYVFDKLQVNKINLLPWTDPFRPTLLTYRRSVHAAPDQIPKGTAPPLKRAPSVVGMPWKNGKDVLEKCGFEVGLQKGAPAAVPEQVFHVERQEVVSEAGSKPKINLILYTRPQNVQGQK